MFGKKPPKAPPPPPPAAHTASAPPPPPPTAAPTGQSAPSTPDEISAKLLAFFEAGTADKEGRIHVETLLSALGAMAGFGCQIAVREAMQAGRLPPDTLVVVETKDGGTYYFGDQINQPLLEAPISVWKLVASAAQQAGARQLPDIIDIVKHVTAIIGNGKRNELRVPPENQPHQSPLQALQNNWATAYRTIKAMQGDPIMTGWYFAGAVQTLIMKTKDVIDPGLACRIVMETAVAMSKVDPRVVGYDPVAGPSDKLN